MEKIYIYDHMDNISHAVFGGSIVHALWGEKYGKKALIYSLLAANAPDIDIALQFIPGVDALRASFFHRTLTHSLLFAIVVSPIMGVLVSRVLRTGKSTWKDWMLITFVSLASHMFLDRCTTYGVWILRPFSPVGYEANIISVVDFFFTLPLLAIVLRYIFSKRKKSQENTLQTPATRSVLRYSGVIFAGLYLVGMAIAHNQLQKGITHDMLTQGKHVERVFVAPQFLQPFLRYGVAEIADGSYEITYTSYFDKHPRIYKSTYGYHELRDLLAKNTAIDTLIQRAHGWYQMGQTIDGYTFSDLRFGKIIGWDDATQTGSSFMYEINPTSGHIQSIGGRGSSLSFGELRKKYWARVRAK